MFAKWFSVFLSLPVILILIGCKTTPNFPRLPAQPYPLNNLPHVSVSEARAGLLDIMEALHHYTKTYERLKKSSPEITQDGSRVTFTGGEHGWLGTYYYDLAFIEASNAPTLRATYEPFSQERIQYDPTDGTGIYTLYFSGFSVCAGEAKVNYTFKGRKDPEWMDDGMQFNSICSRRKFLWFPSEKNMLKFVAMIKAIYPQAITN